MTNKNKFMDKPNCPPPEGYKIVYDGVIEYGDYIWDRVNVRWSLVFGHVGTIAGQPVSDNGTVAKAL